MSDAKTPAKMFRVSATQTATVKQADGTESPQQVGGISGMIVQAPDKPAALAAAKKLLTLSGDGWDVAVIEEQGPTQGQP